MRKNLFLLVMLSLAVLSCKKDKDNNPSTPGTTQLTITSSDIANAGDTILMSTDTTDLNNYSLVAGQNVTWDYSTLTENRVDTTVFLEPSQTPGAQYFASISNIAFQPKRGQPLYLYLNKSTDKVEGVGLWANVQGMEIHEQFSDKPIMLKFPITYNMTHKDSGYLETVLNMALGQYIKLVIKQNFDAQYDAIGTLKLPNNKTYQCIREKRTEIDITNVYMGPSNSGPWTLFKSETDTICSYNYLTKNKKWNVASVIVKDFTTNKIKEISYLKE